MEARKRALLHLASCGLFFCGIMVGSSRTNAQSAPEPSLLAAELPDSPSVAVLRSQSLAAPPVSTQSLPLQDRTIAFQEQPAQSTPSDSSTSGSQAGQGSQPPPQPPVGTAAAGVVPANGIAASQPSGVAIAPAKQHRVRTIVVRTGAILAACVAVGSVVALTEGTSSRPPGAR
jgi:hypothetical protein